ncbi:MAG: hypothetical protein JWP61_336 [Friedmanniella sp.]|jgi:hypothetical protein|nr:hypothetical protein [Friedmanniella sp.]
MSAAEPRPGLRSAHTPAAPTRRIRHEARDGLSAAGLSLAGSVLVTVLLWAALRWLV